MLNKIYSSLRVILIKLGIGQRPTIATFGDDLYITSAKCANIAIRHNSDINEDTRQGLTMVFLHVFLHLTDRQMFSMTPDKRADVMNQLLVHCYRQFVDRFSGSNITAGERQHLLNIALGKYNDAASSYGTCKKLFAKGDESPKGTTMWEFGKEFAKTAGHPMDISFILLGSSLVVNACRLINFSEKVNLLQTVPVA